MSELDTANLQAVGVRGNNIAVFLPCALMTKQQALMHAAWLVALADDSGEFDKYLKAVMST